MLSALVQVKYPCIYSHLVYKHQSVFITEENRLQLLMGYFLAGSIHSHLNGLSGDSKLKVKLEIWSHQLTAMKADIHITTRHSPPSHNATQ